MKSVRAIGGYFELEVFRGKDFYPDLIKVNTGRNALEYILLVREYTKVYVPYFTCDVVLEPFIKHKISYEFYHINDRLEIQDIPQLGEGEGLLYTNYFGLKSNYLNEISIRLPRLIIDNAQAFFSSPLRGVDTFYSPRKFFGIPDGGYIYTEAPVDKKLPKDSSYERASHLLLRLDKGPEAGFQAFKVNDKSLEGQPIKRMSDLTKSLLAGLDYQKAREQRNANFLHLHNKLRQYNKFKWLDDLVPDGPMVYPFYTDIPDLREHLIENRIYVATYWPNVIKDSPESSLEYRLATNVVYLPIDQRYSFMDMERIIMFIESLI